VSNYADWFVGSVAIVVGLVTLYGAIAQPTNFYELPKIRWFERQYGRSATRALLGAIGVLMLVLGVAIALGVKLHWNEEQQAATDRHRLAIAA
jgi:hypothetical protein